MFQPGETESDAAETAKRDVTAGAERAGFVARLQIILRQWPSIDRLARATQVSPSAFRKWLKGEAEPSRERLIALADAAQVSIAWLAVGDGPVPRFVAPDGDLADGDGTGLVPSLDAGRFAMLPKRQQAAELGPSRQEAAKGLHPGTEFLALRHDWVRTMFNTDPDSLEVVVAEGHAMSPTISDGDLVLVNTSDRAFADVGIYVLEIAGRLRISRVQHRLDRTVLLISDNPVYQAEVVSADLVSSVRIMGRVVWKGGRL